MTQIVVQYVSLLFCHRAELIKPVQGPKGERRLTALPHARPLNWPECSRVPFPIRRDGSLKDRFTPSIIRTVTGRSDDLGSIATIR
jgi:hypothetical protein